MATVLDLPAELFINIFQDIPARQLQLCRAVCRRFRDLIDNNDKALADRIQDREYDRLHGFIEHHFAYDIGELSFPDALRRWFSRRSLCPNNHCSLVNYGSQIVYATQAAQRYPGASAPAMEHPLSLIAQTMIETQMFVLAGRKPRARTAETPKEQLTWNFDFGSRGYLRPLIEEGILDFASCYDAAMDGERPILSRVVTLQGMLSEIGNLHIITPLDFWSVTGIFEPFLCCYPEDEQRCVAETRLRCHGFCSTEHLCAVLGVPPLPRPDLACDKSPGEGWVAYCVRSPWAYRAVQQALLGDAVPLQIAGFMEELFIY